jgi:ABC-type tungstate transport system permease subunit
MRDQISHPYTAKDKITVLSYFSKTNFNIILTAGDCIFELYEIMNKNGSDVTG